MPRVTKEKETKRRAKKGKDKINRNNINESSQNDKFSFDDEIVIGLRRIDEPEINSKEFKKQKKNAKRFSNTSNKRKIKEDAKHIEEPELIIKSKYMQNYEENIDQDTVYSNRLEKTNKKKDSKLNNRKNKKKYNEKQKNDYRKNSKNIRKNEKINLNKKLEEDPRLIKKREISKKRRKFILKIVKVLILLSIIISGIIFALLSPIFNIKNITVSGNTKISSDTIISLSGLQLEQNIFNFRTSEKINSIKQNAYINSVEIKRSLPDKIKINVTERKATFMIKYGNAYVYINNQGYMLEITSKAGEYPLITNYTTPEDQIKEGNRLCTEDLEKLNDVLKIMEAASSNSGRISKLITQINIADKSNYILNLEKEKKQVYLGDITNLSTKMLWLETFLEEEKNHEGIIFMNFDLNKTQPYFRQKV